MSLSNSILKHSNLDYNFIDDFKIINIVIIELIFRKNDFNYDNIDGFKITICGQININMSIYSYFGSKNNAAARKPLSKIYLLAS
jgi:hypothetical protein